MKKNPKVSVVMSVYNGEKYLREAVDSILNQTFTNFEFVIINDRSTDSSVEIIESYADPRIWLVHNEKNIGLTASLNRGIKLAHGKYIARMDADDISLPKRLETQLKYFDSDNSLSLCSCRAQVFKENGSIFGIDPPNVDQLMNWHLLSWRLLFYNPITHSSVMVKRDAFLESGGYASWAKRSQDYELWSRMSFEYKMILIPDVLIHYRYHQTAVSLTFADEQQHIAYDTIHRGHKCLTGMQINKSFSIHLNKLFIAHYYNIEKYSIESCKLGTCKLLNQIKLSFIKHYQPDMHTQAEITDTIKAVHRFLITVAIHQLSMHSFSVILYILITHPTIIVPEVIRLGGRLVGKILKIMKKKAINKKIAT